MKFSWVLSLVCLFISSISFAQTNKSIDLDDKFVNFKIENVDVNSILPQLRDDNFSFDLTIGDQTWSIALQKSNILSDNYQLNASDGIEDSHNIARPYQGYVLGSNDSRVSLTFNDDFIYGYIRVGVHTTYIEPLRYYDGTARADEFITYDLSDVIPDNSIKCGVEREQEKYRELVAHTHDEEGVSRVGECFEVEWAIASDFLMFQNYGSIGGVENHNIGVANDVQTNYDDEFADELQFIIVEQQVFTTMASDPFTSSTNAGTLLDDFTNWGPSGFNQIHDVGSLWTGRNLNGGTVGIAWVGAICSGVRYNVLMDFTSNANNKRVMVAHELGHNFDATHDAAGSGFIMAPSVNNTTIWSNESIVDIQNFYGFIGCLSNCTPSGNAPVADFLSVVTNNCVPGNVSFTDISTGNPTSWLWTFEGGTPSTSTAQNPSVTYNNPGVYDVTLEVSNNFGTDEITKSNEIEILEGPVAEWFVTVVDFLAIFNSTSINGESYFWDFGDGSFSMSENPTHTYAMDGIYSVSLTVTNDCGSDIFEMDVEVVTTPTAEFSASATTGCTPHAVFFSNESSANSASFMWEFPGGSPATSTAENPTVTYNNAGVYDVTLTAINNSGSDQITKNMYVTVNTPSVSSFSYTVDGAETTFVNTSTDADTYLWDFGDGGTSTMENPTHTYAMAGTYNVVLTATGPCGDAVSSQEVEIVLLPVISFTSEDDAEGCPSLVVVYENNTTGDPTDFMWTFDGGVPSTSTDANPTVVYSIPGTYDVTLSATNAQGTTTETTEDFVTVLAEVTAGFSTGTNGTTVTFVNETNEPGTSYLWDFGDGGTSTMENPQYTYSEEGIYTVTLTATGPCNEDIVTEELNLYTAPTAGFSSNVTTGCNPLSVSYSQQSSSNVTAYQWTFEGGTPATSTAPNPTVEYASGGTFNVELTVTNPAGSDNESIVDYITVNTLPTSAFVAVNNMLTVSFTNNSVDGDSYLWDFGDGNTSTEVEPTYTYATEGNYVVTLTTTNECGDDVSTQTIGANALPSANGAASATVICEGDEVQYTDMSSDNVTSWLWTFEGGTPATSTEQNPVVSYASEGTYDVTLMVTAPAGNDMIDFENLVSVSSLPTAAYVAVNNMQEVTFQNNSTNAESYFWDFGDGEFSTDINPIHTYLMEGEYDVILTATNFCGDVTTMQTVAANSLPTASGIASTTTSCGPTTIMFSDNSSANVESWEWTFEGGAPESSNEQNPSVLYEEPGLYDVTLLVNAAAGSDMVTYEDLIEIKGLPTSEFSFTADDLTYDFSYDGLYADTYLWDFGDGKTSAEANPTHIYDEDGEYVVSLTVSNDCTDDVTTQTINIINSVEDFSNILDLKIYPNPTIDLFYLEMELSQSTNMQIQIMDIHGRVVSQNMLNDQIGSISQTIDMSNEPAGTYLLRFIDGNKVRNAKIVVQR